MRYDNTETTDRWSASTSKNLMNIKEHNILVKPAWQSIDRYMIKYVLHEIPMPFQLSQSDGISCVFQNNAYRLSMLTRSQNKYIICEYTFPNTYYILCIYIMYIIYIYILFVHLYKTLIAVYKLTLFTKLHLPYFVFYVTIPFFSTFYIFCISYVSLCF